MNRHIAAIVLFAGASFALGGAFPLPKPAFRSPSPRSGPDVAPVLKKITPRSSALRLGPCRRGLQEGTFVRPGVVFDDSQGLIINNNCRLTRR
jgi:hypothetical protein